MFMDKTHESIFSSAKTAALALMAGLGIMQPNAPKADAGTVNRMFSGTQRKFNYNRHNALQEKHGTAAGRKLRRKAAKRNLTVGGGYRGALLTWASEQAARRLPKQHGRA